MLGTTHTSVFSTMYVLLLMDRLQLYKHIDLATAPNLKPQVKHLRHNLFFIPHLNALWLITALLQVIIIHSKEAGCLQGHRHAANYLIPFTCIVVSRRKLLNRDFKWHL